MVDAFGKALMDYLNGNKSTYVIRRDDGLVEEHDPGKFFTEYEQWENCEKEILKYVQGRVLDIGGGAGRHALYLQNKGFEVHVIDISPLAVEVMKRKGVKNVYLMDLMKLEFPENYFDSILMMYNNFGLAGTIEGTKKVLKVLYRVSTDKGRIITTIRDPYKTDNPQHLAYHERNRKEGRPAGQIKIRIEYKGEIGDWFDLLMVSPGELESLLKDTGWGILKIVKENGYYGAVLEKV
jgi:SAM-dependent methyltransferase